MLISLVSQRLSPRAVARLCAVLLPIQLVALVVYEPASPEDDAAVETTATAVDAVEWAAGFTLPEVGLPPAVDPEVGDVIDEADVEIDALATGQLPAEPTRRVRKAPASPAAPQKTAFERAHAAQFAATQDVSQPATTRWALLIGINKQLGRVSDNYGSRQDAEELRAHLLTMGWRDDHIMFIADYDATRENLLRGMQWLEDKTDPDSVAIFHYSGHSKKWYGRDYDGDGEVTDEGLWPTDDRFIPDSEFVRSIAGVNAGAFWVNLSTCNSAGFNDPGLAQPGRVLTFSSTETQKSYENPAWSNSVWGYYLFDQAFLARQGDLDRNGSITVEEGFRFARPRAAEITADQRHGSQEAVIVDQLDGDFSFEIPPPPAPPVPDTQPEPEPDAPPTTPCVLFCKD